MTFKAINIYDQVTMETKMADQLCMKHLLLANNDNDNDRSDCSRSIKVSLYVDLSSGTIKTNFHAPDFSSY
jgi:hypothetical protein